MDFIDRLDKILALPSPLIEVKYPEWEAYGVKVYWKRDDLIHEAISGNKWRKLTGHLREFYSGNYEALLTFGGAYSNHLVATAAACGALDIPFYGAIRGEHVSGNVALDYALSQGANLLPLDRSSYREKDISSLKVATENLYIVPEGGGGSAGLLGCEQIVQEIETSYEYIVSAIGTGTTVAGLSRYVPTDVQVVGVPVLKGEDKLTSEVKSLSGRDNFELIWGYHFGGYARHTEELLDFARAYTQATAVPLDYVYTAKMVYAVDDLLRQGYFERGSRMVLLHTGGLMNAAIDM